MARKNRAKKHTAWSQTPDDTLEQDLGNRARHADDVPIKPSKSQRKREASAMQALGEQLVTLPRAHLTRLELPDELRQAVLDAHGMRSHGARARQMQFIGKLMRQLEPDVLRRVGEALDPKSTRRKES